MPVIDNRHERSSICYVADFFFSFPAHRVEAVLSDQQITVANYVRLNDNGLNEDT